MDEDAEPIIMDIGSGHLKAGFANDDQPKCYIPMIVGKPKSPDIMVGMDQKDAYYGQEAINKIEMLNISYPVQSGIVQDIDMLKEIMEHQLFNQELRVSPEEHKILLTEPPNNPKNCREELIERM
jgi:actin